MLFSRTHSFFFIFVLLGALKNYLIAQDNWKPWASKWDQYFIAPYVYYDIGMSVWTIEVFMQSMLLQT